MHRHLLTAVVGWLGGCSSILGLGDLRLAGDDTQAPDGPEAATDAPVFGDGPNCFGVGIVRPCLAALPSIPLVAQGNVVIDTDNDARCQTVAGVDGCVIGVTTMNVAPSSLLRVQGRRPLVVVASGAVRLDGTLDAASRPGSPGAGANPQVCPVPQAPDPANGWAGGSFGGTGGPGGRTNGGLPGVPLPPQPLGLRGGCPGGANGAGVVGGFGGGGVYLISRSSITVNGSINASGAGGPPSANLGGGGGGSGGLIALDAPRIDGAGELFANGGGGASGDSPFAPGTPGRESPSAGIPGAGGSSGGGVGGDGGNGSVGNLLDGSAGMDGLQASGGGGGGAGRISYVGTFMLTGKISPLPAAQN